MRAKNNEQVVYILGAGFSAQFGLPVMSNFLEKSKDMYTENSQSVNIELFRQIYKEIDKLRRYKDYFSGDLTNIEEILSLMEMGEMLGAKSESLLDFKKFISDVVIYYNPIKVDSRENVLNVDDINENLISFVQQLFKINKISEYDVPDIQNDGAKYSVFSFNYDMLLEYSARAYCTKNSCRKNFGFVPRYTENNGEIAYLKLHGTANNPETIITPTWRKYFDDGNSQLWQQAGDILSKANHIRIIGYSLPETDSYLKYFLKWGAAHQDNLKSIDVICLDDSRKSVEKRYRDFIHSKLNFYNKTTETYLRYLAQKKDIEEAHDNLFQPIERIYLNGKRYETCIEEF